jgi:hypothetical protein
MKIHLFSIVKFTCTAVVVFLLTGASALAAHDDLKLEAQLVLGANDTQPKDAGLKPVSHEIEKKLKHLPLKWKHYYVKNEKKFTVRESATKNIALNSDCRIMVKNLGGSRVELTLVDHDKTLGKITQSLHKGQTLVTGAGAEDSIVVLWSD